jgi:hypothetical protein
MLSPDSVDVDLENSVERVEAKLRVEDLELMRVVCARSEKKNTGALIAMLNTELPLPELKYLKRVRPDPQGDGNLVLMGKQESVDALPPETMAKIRALSKDFPESEVPSFAPRF